MNSNFLIVSTIVYTNIATVVAICINLSIDAQVK